MIIEFLVLYDEAVAHAEHVLTCSDEQCDDIAHLYDRLTARYAGLAEVFTFVAGTARGHQYRLNQARSRAQREALLAHQQRSLEAIPQGWGEGEWDTPDPLSDGGLQTKGSQPIRRFGWW